MKTLPARRVPPKREPPPRPSGRSGPGLWAAGATAALAGLLLWVYAPALHGGWVWDDAHEVLRNPAVKGGWGALARMWVAPEDSDYFPLKASVQWLAWHAWGGDLTAWHGLNLALHGLSALLVVRLMRRLGAPDLAAWTAGALFAVHPMGVESVAWISELKNTLALPPLLLALDAHLRAERSGRRGDRAMSLVWFTLSLLCKTSGVMLPLVLLLLAWGRRGRCGWAQVRRTAPYLGVSLLLGCVTLWFQVSRAAAGTDLGLGGWGQRSFGALRALGYYGAEALWPASNPVIHAPWEAGDGRALAVAALLGLGGFAALFCRAGAAARAPERAGGPGPAGGPSDGPGAPGAGPSSVAALGLGFFILNLLPVLGLLPMAILRIAPVADHLAYVSLVGVAGLGGAALGWILARGGGRPGRLPGGLGACALAACVVGACALRSHRIAGRFVGEEAFWTGALREQPGLWLAHNNLGLLLLEEGRVDEAADHFAEAVRARPAYAAARVNLGLVEVRRGRLDSAVRAFAQAARLDPANVEAPFDLGNALVQAGRLEEALDAFARTEALRPAFADAHARRGRALSRLGRVDEALAEQGRAVGLAPADAGMCRDLADTLANAGRLDEAAARYADAIRLDPADAQARANLGLALAELKRPAEAIAQLREALRLRPDYPAAHAYLGFSLAAEGRYDEAVAQYREALRADPGNPDVLTALGEALRASGH